MKIHLFRPFPFTPIRRAVSGAKKIAIIDRNISFGHGGIMASELRSAMCAHPLAPPIFSFIAGLGGRDITPQTIDDVVAHTIQQEQPEADTLWVGLKE